MSLSLISRSSRILRYALLATMATGVAGMLLAQDKPKKADRESKRDAAANTKAKPDSDEKGLVRLREHFEISDDAEWELIAARIIKIGELRRALAVGSPGLIGGPIGDKKKASNRFKSPEQEALRTALKDNLPDAEIKLRLAHSHDVYRDNEARLAKAQEELRAVLTVRQEAVAVVTGLLPP